MKKSWSMLRKLLPFPVLGGLLVVWITLIGYGTSYLAQRNAISRDDLDTLRAEATAEPTQSVGHHSLEEWPPERKRRFSQAPALNAMVERGDLPPVAERLPRNPLVVAPPEQMGPYGGNWNFFSTGPGDMIGMTSMFYETLVRWDPLLQDFVPNLASSWSIEDSGRIYVFHLREEVRWSDGHPFTADDVLFWYRHVLNNSSLTPAVPQIYLRGGEMMTLEKLDDYTIRFVFPEPHGLFMQWVANPVMMEPMAYPRHYFQNFHPDFVDAGQLDRDAQARGFAFWHQVFLDKASWHNPDRPTLAAWKLTRPPPAPRILFERNPYYWKVDPEGNQLPYIDTLTYEFTGQETMLMRFLRGEMGVQFQHVNLHAFPLLMEHRTSGNYRMRQWISTSGSGVLMPNLNHRDPVLHDLFNDRRFRLALSHAINREEINEVMFAGMGRPMQLSPVTTSPLYRARYGDAHTTFDPDKANQLLNEMGLTQRDPKGIRLRPDGQPLRLTIEMFDLIADVRALQLVAEAWTAAGVQTEVKQLARDLYYARMPARLHDVATGSNSNLHTPLIDHMYFVPAGLGARHALGYAAWYMSNGDRGDEPPPEMQKVMRLYRHLERTADPEHQLRLGHKILEINTENLWLIGLVGDVPGLVLVHNDFRNVPDHAVIFGSAGVTAPECYAIEGN